MSDEPSAHTVEDFAAEIRARLTAIAIEEDEPWNDRELIDGVLVADATFWILGMLTVTREVMEAACRLGGCSMSDVVREAFSPR